MSALGYPGQGQAASSWGSGFTTPVRMTMMFAKSVPALFLAASQALACFTPALPFSAASFGSSSSSSVGSHAASWSAHARRRDEGHSTSSGQASENAAAMQMA